MIELDNLFEVTKLEALRYFPKSIKLLPFLLEYRIEIVTKSLNGFLMAITICLEMLVCSGFLPPTLISAASSTDASVVPSIAWNQTYTGGGLLEVDSVVQTTDGFLLGCTTLTEIGLVKVDALGNMLWNKTYDAIGSHLSKWLVQTEDGAYAVAGQYEGDFWLAKIDDNGNLMWNHTYKGEGFSSAVALTQTNDGGFALVGQTALVGPTGLIWLVKTDASGNEQWNKTLGVGVVVSIIQTSDGGYALSGGVNNPSDYLLIKTDSAGEVLWTKTYGSQDKDFSNSIVQTSDGGYALGGWMWLRSNGGGTNIAIVKTDSEGILQWTQYYGGGQSWSMAQASDGGFAIAGTLLVKTDSTGTEQWKLSFEDNNATTYQAYSVIQLQDGSYAIAGVVASSPVPQAWLAKISLTLPNASPTPSPAPTPSIAEFSPWMIVALLAMATALLVDLGKKNRRAL
jgi:hypothetical protein